MGNEPRLGSKVFYKIGEVSQIAKLPAYVLRFWESEFPFLKPKKSRGNQRLYVRREVETVLGQARSGRKPTGASQRTRAETAGESPGDSQSFGVAF